MFSNIDPLGLLALAAVLLLLIVPTVIAYRRKVKRLWLVVVVNLAGITGVLWFVALYMAMTMRTRTADITPPNVRLDANGERPINTHQAA
ncbi:superinfection immunity protein [Streptomyces sp. NPDC058385]|uniref:superinfection immunity protein n=1 Tax=Streptomyces sp. NPDC058385 TaxID=3346473 RepID=UPI003648296B